MELIQQLIETWEIHNRITLYLLESIPPEALADTTASKGRNVGEQFAHIHNVRLMWLGATASAGGEEVKKIEKEEAQNKEMLANAIQASGQVMATILAELLGTGQRIKGFKPHTTAFLGYLIAHESHHRGQIMLALKQGGHPVDKKTMYGLWEWGVR